MPVDSVPAIRLGDDRFVTCQSCGCSLAEHYARPSGDACSCQGCTAFVATTLYTGPQRHGDPRFYQLLEECAQTHSGKSFDYTPADDPLANFKRSEKLGVPAWKGCMVRMGDKFGRLEQLANGKAPKNESLRDTLMDLAVYSLLCVLLLEDSPQPIVKPSADRP